MRVAIDAHMVGHRETGNERYILNLIAGLARVDSENTYTLLVTEPEAASKLGRLPANFAVEIVRPSANVPRLLWAIPQVCRRVQAQALHTSYFVPPVNPCPSVVSVHDLSYEEFPKFLSPRDRRLLSAGVPASCRIAARVVAISEWTKQDLIRHYRIRPEKVSVVYGAATASFAAPIPPNEISQVRDRFAGGRRYILSVGNILPRKNLARLVEAFQQLVVDGTIGEDTCLVIVGQAQWGSSEVFRRVEAYALQDRVTFAGYVSDEELRALYRGAEVFVYPSLYEGFGLPPLEAMASEAPVVCSTSSCLPEIVGKAAEMFDPYSVAALAVALRKVLTSEARKRELISAGLVRVGQFSWDQAARAMVTIYREVAGLPATG